VTDPFDLERFVHAQAPDFSRALKELQDGNKRSHWMWYVFPQFDGLGSSTFSRRYAIKSRAEAVAYLAHPVLGPRLMECAEALLAHRGRSARQILGSPDDLKLRSSATLFAEVAGEGVFTRLLDQFFEGAVDEESLRLLRASEGLA
jgi:uncharacterized protein (DUF1810 family)